MNRDQFIKDAPAYYVLGISLAFQQIGAETFVDAQTICRKMMTGGPRPQFTLLPNSPLFVVGMNILRDQEFVEIVEDPFGPTLYSCISDVDVWISEEGPKVYPLFQKYGRGLDEEWVKDALLAVVRRQVI